MGEPDRGILKGSLASKRMTIKFNKYKNNCEILNRKIAIYYEQNAATSTTYHQCYNVTEICHVLIIQCCQCKHPSPLNSWASLEYRNNMLVPALLSIAALENSCPISTTAFSAGRTVHRYPDNADDARKLRPVMHCNAVVMQSDKFCSTKRQHPIITVWNKEERSNSNKE